MALRDWLSGSGGIATANIAIVATVRPPALQQEAVVDEEKKENKPRLTGLQSGESGPDNPGVREDSSLAPVICADCKRFEVVDFTNGRDTPVAGCLYPADGSYPDGWKRIPEGLKECMWEKRSPSLNH